ncbi:peroxiredoxin [Agarivorans sp. OAG1]|uniref:OsmC family protein n=1 Tax=Agarivorans sp. OAG1 TaxID=3082387 RepID=UPI002B2D2564|nr:peroxiredoxin [Agarivorans sp. OAG1]
MSEYFAIVEWQRQTDEAYTDNHYSRGHHWHFDGGQTVAASSSPHVVPLPYSVEANVDPEEAFVASLSSCHMLFFLSIAAKNRLVVDSYEDKAVGIMALNEQGKMAMTEVKLNPKVAFSGQEVSLAKLEKMHHQAHQQCFIANSVTTKVTTNIAL